MSPESDYLRCCFSVTCYTDDLAVVHCLRALCQYAEKECRPQIAWGGTTEKAWRRDGRRITLRFTEPLFRDKFLQEAMRLLPEGSWQETGRSDNDPATRQRKPKAT